MRKMSKNTFSLLTPSIFPSFYMSRIHAFRWKYTFTWLKNRDQQSLKVRWNTIRGTFSLSYWQSFPGMHKSSNNHKWFGLGTSWKSRAHHPGSREKSTIYLVSVSAVVFPRVHPNQPWRFNSFRRHARQEAYQMTEIVMSARRDPWVQFLGNVFQTTLRF